MTRGVTSCAGWRMAPKDQSLPGGAQMARLACTTQFSGPGLKSLEQALDARFRAGHQAAGAGPGESSRLWPATTKRQASPNVLAVGPMELELDGL